MANSVSIMAKIARNAQILGYTVVSQGFDAYGNGNVVLAADVGNLTVSYLPAEIMSPQGGVSPQVSPFLGIGIANPGQLMLSSSVSTAGSMADIINGPISANLFAMIAGFANDLVLSDAATLAGRGAGLGYGDISGLPASVGGAGASYWVRVRGTSDWLGMGQ
jgi:hypothetical protein